MFGVGILACLNAATEENYEQVLRRVKHAALVHLRSIAIFDPVEQNDTNLALLKKML